MPFVLSSRMPPQTPELPSEQEQNADFLARFGNSSEASENYSPIPEGYVRGRTKFVVVLGTVMSGLAVVLDRLRQIAFNQLQFMDSQPLKIVRF